MTFLQHLLSIGRVLTQPDFAPILLIGHYAPGRLALSSCPAVPLVSNVSLAARMKQTTCDSLLISNSL